MVLLQLATLSLLPSVWALGVPLASATGLDPINQFCSRWYHQSQVKNGVLYIDGGQASFSDRSQFDNPAAHDDRLNYTGPITQGQSKSLRPLYHHRRRVWHLLTGFEDNYVIAIDLTTSWDWKKNISEVVINKTVAEGTSNYVPKVGSGALFHGPSNDSQIYLYGGVTSVLNTSFIDYQAPTTNQYALWGFNTQTHEWTQYDVSLAAPQRPSWGAFAEAPEQGMAFYLNGMISNMSSAITASSNTPQTNLAGMIALDLQKHTATNISTTSLGDGSPRVRGGMVYIPQIGQKGVLVTVGGATGSQQSPSLGNTAAFIPPQHLADRSLVSMNQVSIFDVASIGTSNTANGWVSQTIAGAAPQPRVDFCVVSASAPDDSSFNIFLYGGWDPTKTAYYDDIWVLSLPSFTWIKIYEGVLPRLGHSCHLVGGRQMITVGGINSTDITGNCDWEWMGVAILDLSTNAWGSVFDAQKPPYEVNPEISAVIGGGPNGEATKLLPNGGWTSFQIANLFTGTSNQSAPYHVPTNNDGAQPPSDKSEGGSNSSSVGAIVGGTVGGVAFLVIAATLLYCWQRRRQQQGQPASELAAHEDAKPETAQFATAVPPAIVDPQSNPQSPNTPTSELAGTSAVNELLGEQRLAELPESRPTKLWNEENAFYDETGDYHQGVQHGGGLRIPRWGEHGG
ncbi:hypothetical protein PG993_000873 [Apiospora rasikravindrae]|uniref:Kelch repeat-containing protein n=1 Tax=Apiospora rasikravindrae TaxID=990691 RepID=A0ABR1U9U3_9PEZI